MTIAPVVELGFHPTDLRERDIPRFGPYLGGPAEALQAALATTRAQVAGQLRAEVAGLAEPTHAQLVRLADLAWQAAFWRYRKVSAPIIADAYLRAYRAAEAGDVPMSVLYDLADKHAEKIGEYFHASSRDALAEGFNTLVNRRIPAKEAAAQVLDAYGLSPRQMRGYVAGRFATPISNVLPRSLKAKARAYIERSFTTRMRKLSEQEEHNIDEQAKQFAWMWLQDKGRLNERAQKIWITAKDEKVCPVCGPLNGQKVGVNERFKTHVGEFWTPGLHPNCRCVVRLIENRFGKAEAWDPREHPRGGDPKNKGRFSRRPAQVAEREESQAAQLMRETLQRTVQPVEEEKPPEPKPKLRMGGKLAMGPPGGKLEMGPAEPRGRLEMGPTPEAPPAPTAAPVQPTGRIEMPEPVRTRIVMPTHGGKLAMGPRGGAAAPPVRRGHSEIPTSYIGSGESRYPVYLMVVPAYDDLNWDPGHDRIQLHHEYEFTRDPDIALRDARYALNNQIEAEYEDIYESDRHHLVDRRKDGKWTAVVDDDAVSDAINWAATSQTDVDIPDPPQTIEWHGPGGKIHKQTLRTSEVANWLEIAGEQFDVRVIRLTEGHAAYEGQTTMTQSGTKAHEEVWVTEGIYDMNLVHDEPSSQHAGVNFYQLDPVAKPRQWDYG